MRNKQLGYKNILISFLAGAAYVAGQDSYNWVKVKVNSKKTKENYST